MSGLAAEAAALAVTRRGADTVLGLRGRLEARSIGGIWTQATRGGTTGTLVIDLAAVTTCDTAGAALVLAAEAAHGGAVRIEGASEQVAAVVARMRAVPRPAKDAREPPTPWSEVFRTASHELGGPFAFLGEAAVSLVRLPLRRRMVRRADLLRTADQAGVQAIPLIMLLGTLIGLILAFQSLVPMRRFGADIYVANLVAISLLRELGPLMSALVLAGRTGSAFAAEIGTMKVNQELDALVTMGIPPMTHLVWPRMAAAVLVMPALTVAMEISGLIGMTIVLVAAGIPQPAIAHQVAYWVRPHDLFGGLAKASVFGMAVAGIGCRAGLATGVGPRAVGEAATEAVVGGIVATVLLDGLFAVMFYRLGL